MRPTTLLMALILTGTVLVAYWDLPKTYFQQDEWAGFGDYLYSESVGGVGRVIEDYVLSGTRTHFNPLTNLISYIQFKVFKLEFPYYAYAAITAHIVNVFLVWHFVSIITKRRALGFFTALLFSVNATAHQAVSWISANVSVEGSLMFSLISLIFFTLALRQKYKLSLMIGASLALLVALLFKETAVFVFFMFPALWWINRSENSKYSSLARFIPIAIGIVGYASVRLVTMVNAPQLFDATGEALKQPGIWVILYRFVVIPLRTLAQTVVPQQSIIDIAHLFIRLSYPQFVLADGAVNPYIAETIAFDFVNVGMSILILALGIWLTRRSSRAFATAFLIVFSSALPLAFIPGKAGFASIVEPRHRYIPSVGSSLLLVLVLNSLVYKILKLRLSSAAFFLFFIMPIALGHLVLVQKDIVLLVSMGMQRKSLLESVYERYPILPEKVLMYTQSNQSYYGLADEEHILPVQSGFGGMLGIRYTISGKLPGCFWESHAFYDIRSQGYSSCNGRGFGYVRSYGTLIETLTKNQLPVESVIAFNWDGQTNLFTDMTGEVRRQLTRDMITQ